MTSTMSKNFNYYLNWVLLALMGRTVESDAIYKEYEKNIDKFASHIMTLYPPKFKTIYRGILLEPKEIHNEKVKPLNHIKSISFTEDLDIALDFANPGSWMSKFVLSMRPESKGYIIEQEPDATTILFHHGWYDKLPLDYGFSRLGMSSQEEVPLAIKQKEVIVKNTGAIYEVTPYENYL